MPLTQDTAPFAALRRRAGLASSYFGPTAPEFTPTEMLTVLDALDAAAANYGLARAQLRDERALNCLVLGFPTPQPRRYALPGDQLRYGIGIGWTGAEYVVTHIGVGTGATPWRVYAAINHYARHNGTPRDLGSAEWCVLVHDLSSDAAGRLTFTRGAGSDPHTVTVVSLIPAGIH